MLMGKIIGTVVATQKLEDLQGVRLLVLQPLDSAYNEFGKPFVAVDSIGAGYGEIVLYAKSKEGAMTLQKPDTCVDAGVSGIIDTVYCP